ncbi:uncharacterized protein PG986_014294 [Apiospora aurea]|uniref:Uncharacterized protein n=1 Tax=Apiospora aurea TaxID=335848 RepID=A0ABR1PSJ8_9PEZI
MNSSLAKMQIPESLAAPLYFDEDRLTTTNIIPKFVLIELHIDPLSHDITTSFGNCIKLWALYPPTDANVRLFLQSRHIMNNFVHMANRLEGGEFCITTEKYVKWSREYIALGRSIVDHIYEPSRWGSCIQTLRLGE